MESKIDAMIYARYSQYIGKYDRGLETILIIIIFIICVWLYVVCLCFLP